MADNNHWSGEDEEFLKYAMTLIPRQTEERLTRIQGLFPAHRRNNVLVARFTALQQLEDGLQGPIEGVEIAQDPNQEGVEIAQGPNQEGGDVVVALQQIDDHLQGPNQEGLEIAQVPVALQDNLQENPPAIKKGRWSEDEKQQFRNGVRNCGRDWIAVARDYVRTRTPDQIFNHSNNVEHRDFMKTIPRRRQ